MAACLSPHVRSSVGPVDGPLIGQRVSWKVYETRPRPLSVPTCSENNMAKSKDKKKDTENGEGDENKDDTKNEEPTLDYDELVKRVCAVAKPLAGRKLTKRLYKTVKKGKRFDTNREGMIVFALDQLIKV